MAEYHPMAAGSFQLSSGYGPRWGTFHAGVDLAAPHGTPIYAPADGVIIQGRDRPQGSVSGFGSWIWLDAQKSCGHDFIFGHVHHPGIMVTAGDVVKAGQQIGVVGSEGQSTGPHLHFEVWTAPGRIGGRHQDPMGWLNSHPHPGPTVNPAPTQAGAGTLMGIDISEHQNGLSLARARAEGIEFVILRLCDGTHRDTAFRSHLEDAERAGLLVATYWYLRAPSEGASIAQQVDVIDQQMAGRRDLGVWIDVESVKGEDTPLLSKADVWAAKQELERRGYHVPGIYSGAWYWERMPGGEPPMAGLGHLWVSNYGRNRNGSPRDLYQGNGGDNNEGWEYPLGDRTPDILQFGSNGKVAGFKAVDVNAYRGTRQQLQAIFTGHTVETPNDERKKMLESLIMDQLAGPGRHPDGTPAFNGWDEKTICEAARTREGGGKTMIELVALTREDVARQQQQLDTLSQAVDRLTTALTAKEAPNA